MDPSLANSGRREINTLLAPFLSRFHSSASPSLLEVGLFPGVFRPPLAPASSRAATMVPASDHHHQEADVEEEFVIEEDSD